MKIIIIFIMSCIVLWIWFWLDNIHKNRQIELYRWLYEWFTFESDDEDPFVRLKYKILYIKEGYVFYYYENPNQYYTRHQKSLTVDDFVEKYERIYN